METVSYEMQVPKELKEVVDLLDAIVEKIQSGADFQEYTTLLPKLVAAVDGVQHVTQELQGQYRDEAAGYLVHKLLGRLAPIQKPV